MLLEQAKAKAKAIEYEAEKFLREQKIKCKEEEIALKQEYELNQGKLKAEFEAKMIEFERQEYTKIQEIEREQEFIEEETSMDYETLDYTLKSVLKEPLINRKIIDILNSNMKIMF